MEKKIIKKFGNRLRIRVSGILEEKEKILLLRHSSLGEKGTLWAPPGGGMKFGSNAEENLIREFKEETGLDISVIAFLFVHEFLSPPLHAIELFFRVKRVGGQLKLGIDPEMQADKQIINMVKFMSWRELRHIDEQLIHQALRNMLKAKDLNEVPGYSKFEHFQ